MQISTFINIHDNEELVLDTIDSIRTYCTTDILAIIDGAAKEWGNNIDLPIFKAEGLYHNYKCSPYRNVALGLKKIKEIFPNSDWYCYVEPDVLFINSEFKKELKYAQCNNYFMVGTNPREHRNICLDAVANLFNINIDKTYYFLGCCLFFNRTFLIKLEEIDFFDKFLFYTNPFSKGFFPKYNGYDLSEELYPSLAKALGGDCMGLSYWDEYKKNWFGNHKKFPVRFRPSLEEKDLHKETSIMHPIKQYDHPIRKQCRRVRDGISQNNKLCY